MCCTSVAAQVVVELACNAMLLLAILTSCREQAARHILEGSVQPLVDLVSTKDHLLQVRVYTAHLLRVLPAGSLSIGIVAVATGCKKAQSALTLGRPHIKPQTCANYNVFRGQ